MGDAAGFSLPRLARKTVFAFLAFVLCFLAWLFSGLLVLLQPHTGRWAARVGYLWGHAMLFAAGCRLVVENRDRLAPDEVRMIVANHASLLDVPAVYAAIPGNLRFILKKELARVPFVGWHAWLGGHFFLDRARPREGHDVIMRAVARAKRHTLIPVIYPEGTRSRDGRLQPLKAGSFQLALEGGFPVQPIAIHGTAPLMPKGAWGPSRGGKVTLRVGPPLSLEDLEGSRGRKVAAARVREALLDLGVPDGAPPGAPEPD